MATTPSLLILKGFVMIKRMKIGALVMILLLLLLPGLGGCTNNSDAYRALDNAGYSDIKTTGYSWFACGQDDWYSTGFTATNPKGKVVSGTVCSGVFTKGATIRF